MTADRERADGAPCSPRSADTDSVDLSTRSLTPDQLPQLPAPAVPLTRPEVERWLRVAMEVTAPMLPQRDVAQMLARIPETAGKILATAQHDPEYGRIVGQLLWKLANTPDQAAQHAVRLAEMRAEIDADPDAER